MMDNPKMTLRSVPSQIFVCFIVAWKAQRRRSFRDLKLFRLGFKVPIVQNRTTTRQLVHNKSRSIMVVSISSLFKHHRHCIITSALPPPKFSSHPQLSSILLLHALRHQPYCTELLIQVTRYQLSQIWENSKRLYI
ncbi:hypothetical protein CY34DRAFT_532164 [Suillus luteus UH-Slu-Lm8-n1]|uniref:Uncharacterized protein n=1 Tax=Suillus luteus UH-Slu-Lm8-n1 TaxID=930992 RepID=A0A0D0APJ4_9AGAM|nr:hypothetical protein CY34DRAFT_532164 [Suillus luteus UH-Slu-Lm8-n1]